MNIPLEDCSYVQCGRRRHFVFTVVLDELNITPYAQVDVRALEACQRLNMVALVAAADVHEFFTGEKVDAAAALRKGLRGRWYPRT